MVAVVADGWGVLMLAFFFFFGGRGACLASWIGVETPCSSILCFLLVPVFARPVAIVFALPETETFVRVTKIYVRLLRNVRY